MRKPHDMHITAYCLEMDAGMLCEVASGSYGHPTGVPSVNIFKNDCHTKGDRGHTDAQICSYG